MKTKVLNLKVIFILLGIMFSLPSWAGVSYGDTLEVTSQGQVLDATDFLLQEGAGSPEVITRVRVKNGVEFYIQLPSGHRVSGITNGVQVEDQIRISNAGILRFRFNYNGTRYYVLSDVNYYGVVQYDGKDAPNDIGVVNSTDSRVGKEVNGVFYLSETESLFVPNHAFKDGMWWEGSLNKDNFVDLRDDQSTNQMSLKEILERAKSRVNGYTNSLNLRIQTNDGTSNGGVYSGSISPTVTITDLRQPAPSLEVSPNTLSFPENGGSQSVRVTSNQSWNASSNQAWLSVSPASGTNDGSFTVTAASNTSQQPRIATITVTGGGGSKTITVNQAAANPQTFTVSLSASPEAGGTVSGNGTYDENSQVTVSASPKEGWKFMRWTENGNEVSSSASFTFQITSNRKLVAVFEPIPPVEYSITVAQLTNGAITPSLSKATSETEISLVITPLSGYRLKEGSLKVTSQSGVNVAVNNNLFIMPAENVTISAEFELIPPVEYLITVAELTNGTITPSLSKATSETEISLVITPLSGYRLKEGSLKVTSQSGVNVAVSNNRFIMPAENVTISAEFEVDTAIEEVSSHPAVKIFPNPATEKLEISNAAPSTKVELYNLQGEVLISAFADAYGEAGLDISSFPSGIYIVRVGKMSSKFIKNL